MVIAEQFVITKQSRGNDASNGNAPTNFADKLSAGSSTGGCYMSYLAGTGPPLTSFSAPDVQQWINRNNCY
jgi:hypothetical protein